MRLKVGLKGLPGVTLLTPESPVVSAALVSFQVSGWDEMALRDALRARWSIIIKGFQTSTHGLRASVVFFLLEEEIDLLLEALGTLIEEGPAGP